MFKTTNDNEIKTLMTEFENVKKEDIPNMIFPEIKIRKLNPIVNGIRI